MPKKRNSTRDRSIHSSPAVDEQSLVPGTTAIKRSIAHAVVIKDEEMFFLAETDGSVPLERGHGFGLYYRDCRFLDGYELRVGGKRPEVLVWNADRGYLATIGLSNGDIEMPDGRPLVKHKVEIRWSRLISSSELALHDTLEFRSLTHLPISFTVSLSFRASFEDIFAVRGHLQGRRGRLRPPAWSDGALIFSYLGADGLNRSLTIHFSPSPVETEERAAHFEVTLGPRESRQIEVSLLLAESPDPLSPRVAASARIRRPEELRPRRDNDEWLQSETQVKSDSLMLNRILDRSLRDLGVLRSHLGKAYYFAAGVPWFVALFGRDSIITALQMLAYNPQTAEQTIRLLARYQGKQFNEWREEEPGKILHELRVGELANLNEIPHTPYYGTIDATPLWLMLIGRHAAWTGDLSLFDDLRPQIEAALEWIDRNAALDADGYIGYRGSKTEKGLSNQGWKDSGDAIVHTDGSLADPPIALVEVQGYVYRAKREIADLYRRAGEEARAASLEREAEELKTKFNRDFWVEDGYFALALAEGKRRVSTLTSNAGHALWAGIAEEEKARRTAEALMSPEMFNGWGIRTLSEKALCYNPLGYHLGTVWPHDNSLIAAGMRQYGFDDAAQRVFFGMIEAAMHFDAYRLPELFGGFCREDYGLPVTYPVACQPQAWAAGSVPFLLKTLLGVRPEAFERRLRVVRPILPPFVGRVEMRNLRVGKARADLLFERTNGRISVSLLGAEGELDLVVED